MYDVIYIKKKKLKLARVLLWGGLVLMVIALIGIFLNREITAFKICLFAGAVPAFIGAFQLSGLYRCPRCRESILSNNSWAALKEKCVPYCPRCGAKIEIEIIE